MERVIITKEQEKALKDFKEMENGILFFVENRGNWVNRYKSLNNVDPDDFALMYAGVYEVKENEFRVGDWVFSCITCKYYKVIGDRELINEREYTLYQKYVNNNENRFAKVVDKWRLSLLDGGRISGEFMEGDVIVTKFETYIHNNRSQSTYSDAYAGYIEKIYLKENAIEV